MKALKIIGIIAVIALLLYLAYKYTIGKKETVVVPGRNDKDLSKLTFLVADNFTPQETTFTFQK